MRGKQFAHAFFIDNEAFAGDKKLQMSRKTRNQSIKE